MNRGRVAGVVLVALVVLASGAVVADRYFLPEQATQVAQAEGTAALSPEAEVLKEGTFTGKTGHDVSGTVSLVRDGDTHYLRFEEYEQTQGPDVFVYLTPAADPTTSTEIDAGIKVPIDGGADGGESTKEGTFVQRLPDDFDPAAYNGVEIWCDDFSIPFGTAPLERS